MSDQEKRGSARRLWRARRPQTRNTGLFCRLSPRFRNQPNFFSFDPVLSSPPSLLRAMMMDVDNVLDERIDPYELEKLYEAYHVQCRRGSPSAMAKFSYAHGLVKSNLSDVRDGVDILEDLLRNDESEKSRRDYVYYLAIAHARLKVQVLKSCKHILKEYDRSLAYLDILRSTDGTTRQVKHLQDLIDERMRRDGLIEMGILGGGLAVAGILAAALISVMRR